ncbi:hypothetical protein LXL04_035314 [Taraxacum kok-saghyz]
MDTNTMDVEEDIDINVVSANDMFRTDVDVYFRDNSAYDKTLNIDSLFIDDDGDDAVFEQSNSNSVDVEGAYNSETDQSVDQSIPNSNTDIVVDQFPSKSSSSSDSGFFEERLYSEGEFSSTEIKFADGSKTEFWRPNVPEPILPVMNMIFENLQKAIDFYTKYARRAGFDTRLGSEKIVNGKKCYKYVICSRSGKAEESSSNSLKLNKANVAAVRAHGIVTGFKGGVDKQGSELRGVFWTDSIAKRNYKEFSDVISFDATYRTNKYNLVFVPFTGIDNHQRCVTFGAALMAQETEEYYIWLLESFLNAFGKQPNVVVTDQDAVVGNAVQKVFTQSKHRLCMWHIGKKLTVYVSAEVIKESNFRKRMQNLICNPCLDPHLFEDKWNSLVAEHKLEDNPWLKRMYSLRSRWIPTYFKDTPLSGLMRTTSRSESENYFFQSFMSNTTNLVMFICKFDAAMDKQRSIQSASDFTSVSKLPQISTRLEFENQASRFYTHKMFSIFQKEVHDCVWTCSVVNCTSVYDHDSFLVLEQVMGEFGENKSVFFNVKSNNFRSHNRSQFQYQVTFHQGEDMFRCKCMVFEHFGFLCRHILSVMKAKFISEIPSKYFIRRWQKGVIRSQELEKTYSFGGDIGGCQDLTKTANKIKHMFVKYSFASLQIRNLAQLLYLNKKHDRRNCPLRKEDERKNLVDTSEVEANPNIV